MTDEEKLTTIKVILEDGGEVPSDEKLGVYLTLAGHAILAWKYHLVGGVPEGVTQVPAEDEMAQIYAVIAGYTHAGAEGEKQHTENGVSRVFYDSDMMAYIRTHVLSYVRVGAVQ